MCSFVTTRTKVHRSFLRRAAMRCDRRSAPALLQTRSTVKERPQKLQPLANTVFLEHGRTRWPRTPQAAHVLQQYAWSSAGAGATSLHQTAGCMLAADIICCCLQAAGPRERPQQIMKQCSTHACPVCFAVPQWHVFVCNIFLKPVATHASPQSSWTRSTIVRPVAAPVGPTGSASGRTGPTKTLQSGTPSNCLLPRSSKKYV